MSNFFFDRGLRPPVSPTGTAAQDPAFFWIEDPSRNSFGLNCISKKKIVLKSSETYAQKIF